MTASYKIHNHGANKLDSQCIEMTKSSAEIPANENADNVDQ